MPLLLKNLLRGAALLLVLAGAALGLALATFNPNDYKAALIEQVKQRTQRTLHLPGDVSLRYFPRLALALGPLSLSEPDSATVFASVEQAQVSLALWPLWRQRFVADQVQISGLSLHLQRDAQGRGNWTSLGEPEPVDGPGDAPSSAPSATPVPPAGPPPAAIELDGLSLTGSRVRYIDAARPGQSLDVQFDLHTGPIQSGKPTALRLHAQVQGAQPALALTLDGRVELRMDPALTGVQWQGLSVDLSGNAGTLQALQLVLNSPQGEFTPARLSAPSLSFTAQGRQPDGRAWSAHGGADVQGDRVARRWQAQALQVTGTLTPQGGDDMRLTGQGQAQLDEAGESAHIDLTGQLDGSAFEVSAGVSAWLQPAYTLNLAMDRLDVDHYQRALALAPDAVVAGGAEPAASGQAPSVASGQAMGPAGARVPLEPAADAAPWATVQARGRWQVQSLTVAGLHAQDVQATWQVKAGQLEVTPLSASLYDGRVNGSLSVQASDPPQWAAQQSWRGVSLGPLLRDAGQTDRLDGVADGELDLRSTGTTPQALKRALQGRVRMAVKDGVIKGVNLAALIRQAQQKVSQWQGGSGATEPATAPEQTDFSALSASFQIQNGVARNKDLVAQSPLLRVGGQGTVDLGASRLDYTVRATVVPTLQGQGGPALQALRGLTVPVRLSGPLDAVAWEVDRAALARELIKAPVNSARIKAEVQRQLDTEKESLQNRLKNQLNKLWGR